jgi:hypothetical protein
MSIPTRGETYSKLIEHIRLAQEDAALMAHLYRDDHSGLSRKWLHVSELMKKFQYMVTDLAKGALQ